VWLNPQDMFVVFTDGVVEARSADGEEFGEERLLSVLRTDLGSQPSAVLGQIMSVVRKFASGVEQHDDITALVLRFQPVAASRRDAEIA
jgi:sigma-B regulation protein RsbU (phosphoserine phosphatase)